ncbi:ABC transporter ATP-binding protein [Parapusillimonas granuli]|uniref:ABC transporter ATP-binding protein n=1 Tax=Parapusillimonas granuli TaxID=380911 RepID=A0A853G5Q3_9BURK|nr:ABC transporter ATP-binding protein [Parapusillimonas granuli]MBB5215308.1 branched-chain amino acid transport system ATP-binding protein [Parapusillimonas granuli]NYT50021.1 ABC transporter ATP-binding protein [Parapusillimonas granuli]
MTLLRTENLCKSFGNLQVTTNVSLSVFPGERHVIIGPNGAGKTSLVHQLTGQLRCSSGRILFKERDITGMEPEAICQMGIGRTFQKNTLFPSLSVAENVRLAVQAKQGSWYQALRNIDSMAAHWERSYQILDQIQLTDSADQRVSNLSYGEQRQLEIAIALAAEPELLLLDEPTSGMSPAETNRMIDLVRTLPESLTILMIEHDMKVVFSLADTITVLYYGEVLASGTPDEIKSNEKVREVYLGGKH